MKTTSWCNEHENKRTRMAMSLRRQVPPKVELCCHLKFHNDRTSQQFKHHHSLIFCKETIEILSIIHFITYDCSGSADWIRLSSRFLVVIVHNRIFRATDCNSTDAAPLGNIAINRIRPR
jgi:hypothetical protein